MTPIAMLLSSLTVAAPAVAKTDLAREASCSKDADVCYVFDYQAPLRLEEWTPERLFDDQGVDLNEPLYGTLRGYLEEVHSRLTTRLALPSTTEQATARSP